MLLSVFFCCFLLYYLIKGQSFRVYVRVYVCFLLVGSINYIKSNITAKCNVQMCKQRYKSTAVLYQGTKCSYFLVDQVQLVAVSLNSPRVLAFRMEKEQREVKADRSPS